MSLALQDVTKEYPGGVRALDGVSLQVDDGELVGVVGPSGSGKSTLLHVMGTLERPSGGRVSVAGADVGDLDDRELAGLRATSIGFVFQAFFLIDGMTALENVAQGLLYSGTPVDERTAAARTALERVGLGHRLHHHPEQLSGGERQRVAIARALANRPRVLLADEPTGALDYDVASQIISLLERLRAQHETTILLVTNDMAVAKRADRTLRMRDGRVELSHIMARSH
jgi:putative ABC transport system ATP-binding protein